MSDRGALTLQDTHTVKQPDSRPGFSVLSLCCGWSCIYWTPNETLCLRRLSCHPTNVSSVLQRESGEKKRSSWPSPWLEQSAAAEESFWLAMYDWIVCRLFKWTYSVHMCVYLCVCVWAPDVRMTGSVQQSCFLTVSEPPRHWKRLNWIGAPNAAGDQLRQLHALILTGKSCQVNLSGFLFFYLFIAAERKLIKKKTSYLNLIKGKSKLNCKAKGQTRGEINMKTNSAVSEPETKGLYSPDEGGVFVPIICWENKIIF